MSTTIYTPQMMLLCAFAAGAGDTQPYVGDCKTALELYPDIKARLGQIPGANWTIVWGPAIFSFPINYKGRHVDNVIYVAQDGTTNNYVLAIAGTDPDSIADWVFEDFLVNVSMPWFLGDWGRGARISLGTFTGLTILLNISPPCTPIPGTGQKLLTFLKSIATRPINLYTTGHSLGGALAPSLTLALYDLRLLFENVTFHPFAFAGPTPGNAAFAAYFNEKFPNGLQRVWNALDIVPHVWYTPQMQQLPSLYGQPMAAVTDAVNFIVPHIESIGYTPLNNQAATFSGPRQNPNITTFEQYMTEAKWQHTTAYYNWATGL